MLRIRNRKSGFKARVLQTRLVARWFVPPHESNDGHIYLVDADGSNQERLTLEADHYFDLNWSTDGDWLAFAAGLDEPGVYLQNVTSAIQSSEQSARVRITAPGGQYTNPRWQQTVYKPVTYADRFETLAKVDLNCDGVIERIRVEASAEPHYFNNNLTYERILVETGSGQDPHTLWEYSAQEASVSYFTPTLIQIETCEQFLAVLGDEGRGNGLKVFGGMEK